MKSLRLSIALILARSAYVAAFGPTLKPKYDKKEDIPKGYADLYSEEDGAFVFTAIEGQLNTDKNVQRLEAALEKERKDHKAAKTELAKFKKLGDDPEEVHAKLDRIEELEALAGDKADPEKLDKIVEAKVKAATAKLSRELDAAKSKNQELEQQNNELGGKIKRGKIETEIRAEAAKQGVLPAAIDDLVFMGDRFFDVADDEVVQTKEGNGQKAGLSVGDWLKNQRTARPHYWPNSQGANARGGNGGGGSGANPWSKAGWNKTQQGAYVQQHGEQKAAEFARSAGSELHAAHPPQA